MKPRRQLPNLILGIGVVCFATVTILAFARSVVVAGRSQTTHVTEIPKVISKVKSLEVIGVTIRNQGDQDAVAVIEIRNNSDKAITAISIEAGDDKDAAGVSVTGFKGGDEPPIIVLQPHGTIKMRMPLSNVPPNSQIKVGAVMYADETEEGDEATLGTLHRQKEHEKRSNNKGNEKQ